jgi:hypothetical protein
MSINIAGLVIIHTFLMVDAQTKATRGQQNKQHQKIARHCAAQSFDIVVYFAARCCRSLPAATTCVPLCSVHPPL